MAEPGGERSGQARDDGPAPVGLVPAEFAALGHLPFVDVADCRVDPRTGRVVLPAPLRPAFGDGAAYVRPMASGQVWLWTPLDFVRYQKRIEANRPAGMVGPRSRARTFASVQQVGIDGQGRFVLNQKLRDHLGITDSVVLAGAADRIELWRPESWYADEAPQLDEWDLEAETFGGLDLETGT